MEAEFEFDVDAGARYTVEVGGLFVGSFIAGESRRALALCDSEMIALHQAGPKPSAQETMLPSVNGRRVKSWRDVFALEPGTYRVSVPGAKVRFQLILSEP